MTEDDKSPIDGCHIKLEDQVKYVRNIIINTLTEENHFSFMTSLFINTVKMLLGNYAGLDAHMLIKLLNSK